MNTNAQLLRRALIADSLISTGSGVLVIFASAPLAEFMGVADPLVMTLLGIGMVIFGLSVGRASRQADLTSRAGYSIAALNAVWVIGSWLILVTDAFALTTAGRWAILIGADIVLTLAVLDFLGARKIGAAVRAHA